MTEIGPDRGAAWGPGLALGALGAGALWLLADRLGGWGYATVLALPFAVGCILGYASGVRKIVLVLISVLIAGGLIGGAITAELAGVLCGLILLGTFVVPALLGIAAGSFARVVLRRTRMRRGDYLSMLALLVTTGAAIGAESMLVGPSPEETIRTSRILPFEASRVWDRLIFYEEVRHDPPLLARIGLPHPLSTSGEIAAIGDVKRCNYNKGWLVKRITGYRPAELLSFDVIEQQGIEDRSVRLVSGSFRFEPAGAGRTRVTLTTVYEPLLSARMVWRPFEIRIARALHDHVLTGIELESRRVDPALVAGQAP